MSERADPPVAERAPGRRRAVIALVCVAVAGLVTLGWLWQRSLIPGTYSVLSMGRLDYGGGPVPAAGATEPAASGHGAMAMGDAVSVTSLVGPDRPADVSVTLVARSETIQLAGPEARTVEGFTLEHESPGPQLTVHEGELLEVTLVNESVPDGIALHWHGVDVPNGEDGVAGVTQDAVEPGGQHVYRFVAEDAGTYWYHSHQVADEQVAKGLFGALVVLPAEPADSPGSDASAVAIVHTYSGIRTVNGVTGTDRLTAEPGADVRVRVINTNNGPLRTWVTGAPYTVAAVDGRELNVPTSVEDETLVLPAGGRADLVVGVPDDGGAVGVNLGGGTILAVGPQDARVADGRDPQRELDLLTYGTPTDTGIDPATADRRFEYRIGRQIGFLDGQPGFWWTINGGVYPDVPMYVVEEGDVVVMTIANHSGQVHPMHLHGHHAVVVSRGGVAASGSPWWIDSLDVQDGETYVIAFVADNPGIWMDHCHNLQHPGEGLVAHLMYAGVTTPFEVGGTHRNNPE